MEGKGLGFRPGPIDERDVPLKVALERLGVPKTTGSTWWYSPFPRLNQEDSPSCVGFSRVIATNCSPIIRHYDDKFAFDLYKLAQERDTWEGTDYEGTSVRAGAKAAQEKGLIKSYAFTYDVDEMALWILNRGPVCIGINWYSGLNEATKANGYLVRPTGYIQGGHAIAVDGVRLMKDKGDYFRCINSWGLAYGYSGRAKIAYDDMRKLLSEEGAVCCTATETN